MRISKRRLRMIIKEEYTKLKRQGLLSESTFSSRGSSSRLTVSQLRRLIREALDEEDDSEEEDDKPGPGEDAEGRMGAGDPKNAKKNPRKKKPKAQDMR